MAREGGRKYLSIPVSLEIRPEPCGCVCGLVEVFQQHGEGRVLHLKFGAVEGAFRKMRTAEFLWIHNLLGVAEIVKGGLNLAGEVGAIEVKHGVLAMSEDCHEMIKLARVVVTCHMTPQS